MIEAIFGFILGGAVVLAIFTAERKENKNFIDKTTIEKAAQDNNMSKSKPLDKVEEIKL